jgi:hypothetical protein
VARHYPVRSNTLTLASPFGTLQAMRGCIRRGGTVRARHATRTDLLLETLALRHQLGVLARSHRRFRPTDRLLWLLLRWLWPRWREALVLIQPATVDRWYREGVRRCWRRRETSWKTTYRFIVSRSDSAYGRGEFSVGRAADSRRIAEARNRHIGTHGLALSARPPAKTVTDLAYILREPPW